MYSTSSACCYIDDIPCFTADGVCNLEVVVCAFGGASDIGFGIEGSACQAVTTAFFDQWGCTQGR